MQFNDHGHKAFPRTTVEADFLPCSIRVKLENGVLVAAGDEPDIGVLTQDMHIHQINSTVALTTKPGTILAVADGPIAYGADVFCAADGRVSATGTIKRGVCFHEATAAGDQIEILNISPVA